MSEQELQTERQHSFEEATYHIDKDASWQVLCSQIGQLPIGEAWCCSWCCQAKCREWHKLSPQQQGAPAAASLARAAAPQSQPSPAPTPSTSRASTKLFENLKDGGSQERAIKKRTWQRIDDVVKTYYPNDVTGLFASLLQDKRVRTAIPSDTKFSGIVANVETAINSATDPSV